MPKRFWISVPTMAVRIACPTPCGTWLAFPTSTPAQETSLRRLYSERTGNGGNNAPVLRHRSAAPPKTSTARITLNSASRSLSTLQEWMYLRLITPALLSRFWPALTTPSPRAHLLISGKDFWLQITPLVIHCSARGLSSLALLKPLHSCSYTQFGSCQFLELNFTIR